ncbi:MAG: type II secretion system F family protein [Rhizobiaceae bacterium]
MADAQAQIRFRFMAYGANGSRETGYVDAVDEADAVRRLSRDGKIPYELTAARGVSPGAATRPFSLRSLFEPRLDLTRLFADLAVMLNSGFNIDIALHAVADAEPNKAQRARISAIHSQISEGKSVAEAFAAQPEIPPDVAALVASGENSGRLDTVFTELAKNYTERARRRGEITEALLYPGFLIFVLFAAVLLLSLYLVPAIEPIFENGGVETPRIVTVLSGFGGFISAYGMAVLIGFLVALLLLLPLLRTQTARARFNNMLARIPVASGFARAVTRGRYLRVMSLLLANGVPLHDSMQLAASSAPVAAYRDRLGDARQAVSGGETLWRALEQSGVFTESIVSLVKLGEESNNLAPIMGRAAVMTEAQLQRSISRFLTFLTPAITIFLGFVVGTLVISVMTTLLSINEIAIR